MGILDDVDYLKKEAQKTHLENQMKEIFLRLSSDMMKFSGLKDFLQEVLVSFSNLFGNSEQSSILKMGEDGMLRAAVSIGYKTEDISNFKIPYRESFIYVANGNFDSACIINDLGDMAKFSHKRVTATNSFIEEAPYIQSSLEIPIVVDEEVQYIISIDSLRNHVFGENDLYIANFIRTQFQILLNVFNLYQNTLHLSRYDALTGLMNRGYCDRKLIETMEKAENSNKSLIIVLYDLDHLKGVNDNFGHGSGDRYILKFRDYLLEYFCEEDTVARIGGDEFITISYDVQEEDILRKVEAMYESFLSEEWIVDNNLVNMGFSYGLTHYVSTDKSFKHMLRRADKAMYAHKKSKIH